MEHLHFADECWWFAFGMWWVSELPNSTTEAFSRKKNWLLTKSAEDDKWKVIPCIGRLTLCWHCLPLVYRKHIDMILPGEAGQFQVVRMQTSEISHAFLFFFWPCFFFPLICCEDTLQQRKRRRPWYWKQAVQCHPCLEAPTPHNQHPAESTSKGFTHIWDHRMGVFK